MVCYDLNNRFNLVHETGKIILNNEDRFLSYYRNVIYVPFKKYDQINYIQGIFPKIYGQVPVYYYDIESASYQNSSVIWVTSPNADQILFKNLNELNWHLYDYKIIKKGFFEISFDTFLIISRPFLITIFLISLIEFSSYLISKFKKPRIS